MYIRLKNDFFILRVIYAIIGIRDAKNTAHKNRRNLMQWLTSPSSTYPPVPNLSGKDVVYYHKKRSRNHQKIYCKTRKKGGREREIDRDSQDRKICCIRTRRLEDICTYLTCLTKIARIWKRCVIKPQLLQISINDTTSMGWSKVWEEFQTSLTHEKKDVWKRVKDRDGCR